MSGKCVHTPSTNEMAPVRMAVSCPGASLDPPGMVSDNFASTFPAQGHKIAHDGTLLLSFCTHACWATGGTWCHGNYAQQGMSGAEQLIPTDCTALATGPSEGHKPSPRHAHLEARPPLSHLQPYTSRPTSAASLKRYEAPAAISYAGTNC